VADVTTVSGRVRVALVVQSGMRSAVVKGMFDGRPFRRIRRAPDLAS
jgi:hypothetical protein